MTDLTSTQTITQKDIDGLLQQLKVLREQIEVARKSIAPLEENLKQAFDSFQIFVGAARRQSMRVQAEIANLRIQISNLNSNEEDFLDFEPDRELGTNDIENTQNEKDPEVLEKDMLFEHLLRVLDPMDDAELFANLQSLCQDPTVSLAEVLEQSPWELVWQAKPVQENFTDQYSRLQGWKSSLSKQLEALNRVEERLKKDPRYGLWQQKQKGDELWKQFLQQALEQQDDQNQELQIELENLQQEWEQLRSM